MASIYRRKDSSAWWARFKDPSGRWKSASTGETNKTKAREIAIEYGRAGRSLAESDGSMATVSRVIREIHERLTGEKAHRQTVGKFFNAWLARAREAKAAKTTARYKSVVDGFLETIGDLGKNADVAALTPSTVQKYVDARLKAGTSPQTVALDAKIVGMVCKSAIRAGLMTANPVASVEIPSGTAEVREPFTFGEVETILADVRGTEWETVVLLGAYAGVRLGDASQMRWENIDLTNETLRFVPTKTSRGSHRKTIEIPLHPRLAKYLEDLAGADDAQGSQLLCPTLATHVVSGRAGLSRMFAGVMSRSSIDRQNVTRERGSYEFNRKSFHSLRHFFVSQLANADVAPEIRRKLAGHTDERVHERYTKLERDTLRRAITKLPGKS